MSSKNEVFETLVKLFPFFTPDSHYATKPYLYGCLCSNYAFLCLIRASATPEWVVGTNQTPPSSSSSEAFTVSISTHQISILAIAGFFAISAQICVSLRRLGHKIAIVTLLSTLFSAIQASLMLTLTIQFASLYPFSSFIYSAGGYAALFSGSMAATLSFIFFLADVAYFSAISKETSMEQKKFEFANAVFILYILFGAGWFCYLENWGFERASEFCLMTLLTIGYGNIVPATFWGRFFMIFYTSVGLCVAGFFIIAVEDVIIQDTNESPLLRSNESMLSFQANNNNSLANTEAGSYNNEATMDILDPDLINQLPPLPLTHTMTNTSIMSRNSIMSKDSDYPFQIHEPEPLWLSVWKVVRVVFWILGWWLGAGAVFAYFEGWSYFNGIYFAFVSMTGIGYGDFTIRNPAAVEAWWIFLFNAISIIAFFISIAGRTLAKKVASEHLKIHRKRLVRQIRRKRIKIRTDTMNAVPMSSVGGGTPTTTHATFFGGGMFNEPEMIEYNQNSLTRRLQMQKSSISLQRNASSQRLQNIFLIGGAGSGSGVSGGGVSGGGVSGGGGGSTFAVSETSSSNPKTSFEP